MPTFYKFTYPVSGIDSLIDHLLRAEQEIGKKDSFALFVLHDQKTTPDYSSEVCAIFDQEDDDVAFLQHLSENGLAFSQVQREDFKSFQLSGDGRIYGNTRLVIKS